LRSSRKTLDVLDRINRWKFKLWERVLQSGYPWSVDRRSTLYRSTRAITFIA
jgi:hypothetical protein